MSEYRDEDELLNEYARRRMEGFEPQDPQESWRRFEQRVRPSNRFTLRRVAAAVVVLFFAVLGAAVVFPNELTAVGERITQIRVYLKGTDGVIHTHKSHVPGDPGKSNLDPSMITTEELKRQVDFPVLAPAWLPDGFVFRGHSVTDLGKHAKEVSSYYESEGRLLAITQTYAIAGTSTDWFDIDDTTMIEVVVRNVPATILYREKDSWSSLSWSETDIDCKISGPVTPETITRIAESMKVL